MLMTESSRDLRAHMPTLMLMTDVGDKKQKVIYHQHFKFVTNIDKIGQNSAIEDHHYKKMDDRRSRLEGPDSGA